MTYRRGAAPSADEHALDGLREQVTKLATQSSRSGEVLAQCTIEHTDDHEAGEPGADHSARRDQWCIVVTLLAYGWTTRRRRSDDVSHSESALERCADPRG
jgi:hypothetical protein